MPQQTGTPEESSPQPSSCFQRSPLSLAFGQHPPGFQLGQALWTINQFAFFDLHTCSNLWEGLGQSKGRRREWLCKMPSCCLFVVIVGVVFPFSFMLLLKSEPLQLVTKTTLPESTYLQLGEVTDITITIDLDLIEVTDDGVDIMTLD